MFPGISWANTGPEQKQTQRATAKSRGANRITDPAEARPRSRASPKRAGGPRLELGAAFLSTSECEIDSCREDEVVALGTEDRRVCDVAVAYCSLPSKPFIDLRNQACVQREAVLVYVAQIGVEIKMLGERRWPSQLLGKVLAHRYAREVTVHARVRSHGGGTTVTFARVVQASQDIQGCVGVIDCVPA